MKYIIYVLFLVFVCSCSNKHDNEVEINDFLAPKVNYPKISLETNSKSTKKVDIYQDYLRAKFLEILESNDLKKNIRTTDYRACKELPIRKQSRKQLKTLEILPITNDVASVENLLTPGFSYTYFAVFLDNNLQECAFNGTWSVIESERWLEGEKFNEIEIDWSENKNN